MSSMPESIWLHKDEKYNTGDFGIWYDADFSEKVKNEGIENYVEYVPKYRMDEAIRKTKLTSEDRPMRKKKLSLRSVIRRQMEAQGMSQSDLANLLGTSRQYVNGYLTGRCNISHDHIETLLDYFDLVHEPEQ